jgi:glycerol uptake facilitator protein
MPTGCLSLEGVPVDLSFGDIFLSEILGTAALTLLGCGVVANAILTKNKGFGGGFLMINFGWGFAVMVGILLAAKSHAHLNPAVTLGTLAAGNPQHLSFGDVIAYLLAEFIGAFIGAVLCWAAYKDHFDEEPDAGAKLAVFSTGPAIRNTVSNLITEIIGTFVLVFTILSLSQSENGTPGQLGYLTVSFLVVVIGTSLGGPTGYAINPARDLGPRVAHFVLPIRGKGDSDWTYAWIPVVGPIIGGVIGGVLGNWVNYV